MTSAGHSPACRASITSSGLQVVEISEGLLRAAPQQPVRRDSDEAKQDCNAEGAGWLARSSTWSGAATHQRWRRSRPSATSRVQVTWVYTWKPRPKSWINTA